MSASSSRPFSSKALTRLLTDVLQGASGNPRASRPAPVPRLASQADVQAAALAFQEAVETELLTRRLQQNRAVNFPVLDALLGRLASKTAG